MASTNKHHHELTDGVGKCSVPMWMGGMPAGFCDKPAYGYPSKCEEWRDAYTGERRRFDGKYNGFVPGLACEGHAGPSLKELSHQGDPCKYCAVPHDDVPIGPCKALQDAWQKATKA